MIHGKELIPHASRETMSHITLEMIQKKLNKMTMNRTCHTRPQITTALTLASSYIAM